MKLRAYVSPGVVRDCLRKERAPSSTAATGFQETFSLLVVLYPAARGRRRRGATAVATDDGRSPSSFAVPTCPKSRPQRHCADVQKRRGGAYGGENNVMERGLVGERLRTEPDDRRQRNNRD